jgi:hypothetical protein
MGAPYRLPLATARAIDRLAWRAHAFHRYAHHPLCGRYAGEVLTFGRTRLCRGCVAACAGGALGLALGGLLLPGATVAGAALAAGSALGALSLRYRLSKLLGRLLPACGVGVVFGAALAERRAGVAILAAAATTIGLLLYRRRQPNRAPCLSCPELRGPPPCSGFAPIVRRERAFRRAADRLIATAGTIGPSA